MVQNNGMDRCLPQGPADQRGYRVRYGGNRACHGAVPPRECSVVWSALSSSRGSPSGNVARSTPSAGPVGHYARFQISLRAIGSPCEPGLYPGPSAASCRNAANLSSSRRWAASYLCNTSSASAVRCPSARSSSIRRRWRAKAFSPLAAIASKSSILLARSESMSAAMHDGLKGGVTSLRPADCRDGSTLISSQGRLWATDPVSLRRAAASLSRRSARYGLDRRSGKSSTAVQRQLRIHRHRRDALAARA